MADWGDCIVPVEKNGVKVDEIATLACIEVIIKNLFNIAFRLLGIAAFIMLIVGGFQFLTAGGDPKKTQAASSTLTYAIFGLVIVIAAWFILLLIENFTGIETLTSFSLPF